MIWWRRKPQPLPQLEWMPTPVLRMHNGKLQQWWDCWPGTGPQNLFGFTPTNIKYTPGEWRDIEVVD